MNRTLAREPRAAGGVRLRLPALAQTTPIRATPSTTREDALQGQTVRGTVNSTIATRVTTATTAVTMGVATARIRLLLHHRPAMGPHRRQPTLQRRRRPTLPHRHRPTLPRRRR